MVLLCDQRDHDSEENYSDILCSLKLLFWSYGAIHFPLKRKRKNELTFLYQNFYFACKGVRAGFLSFEKIEMHKERNPFVGHMHPNNEDDDDDRNQLIKPF